MSYPSWQKWKRQASYDITYMWNPTFSFQSLLRPRTTISCKCKTRPSSYQKGVFKVSLLLPPGAIQPPRQLYRPSPYISCNHVGDNKYTYIYFFHPQIGFSNFHLEDEKEVWPEATGKSIAGFQNLLRWKAQDSQDKEERGECAMSQVCSERVLPLPWSGKELALRWRVVGSQSLQA